MVCLDCGEKDICYDDIQKSYYCNNCGSHNLSKETIKKDNSLDFINRLCFIKCALEGGTRPNIEPNEINIELFEKAMNSIIILEKVKQIIQKRANIFDEQETSFEDFNNIIEEIKNVVFGENNER